MIYGIGIDIVNIQRIKDASDRWGRRFLEKILTDQEISYCHERRNPYPSLAVRFAAKEALFKALGSEIAFSFREAEVVNDERGRPSLKVQGKLAHLFMERSITGSHVSLSHEREFGVACVVLEA